MKSWAVYPTLNCTVILEQTYVVLNNQCADLAPQMLVDCNGNNLCVFITEDGCQKLVNNSVFH